MAVRNSASVGARRERGCTRRRACRVATWFEFLGIVWFLAVFIWTCMRLFWSSVQECRTPEDSLYAANLRVRIVSGSGSMAPVPPLPHAAVKRIQIHCHSLSVEL